MIEQFTAPERTQASTTPTSQSLLTNGDMLFVSGLQSAEMKSSLINMQNLSFGVTTFTFSLTVIQLSILTMPLRLIFTTTE